MVFNRIQASRWKDNQTYRALIKLVKKELLKKMIVAARKKQALLTRLLRVLAMKFHLNKLLISSNKTSKTESIAVTRMRMPVMKSSMKMI